MIQANNESTIRQIREDLKELTSDKDNHAIQAVIHSLNRNINKLQVDDEKLALLFRHFASDFMQAYTAEVKFHNLNSGKIPNTLPARLELSESFFNSIHILRDEILKALEKL